MYSLLPAPRNSKQMQPPAVLFLLGWTAGGMPLGVRSWIQLRMNPRSEDYFNLMVSLRVLVQVSNKLFNLRLKSRELFLESLVSGCYSGDTADLRNGFPDDSSRFFPEEVGKDVNESYRFRSETEGPLYWWVW